MVSVSRRAKGTEQPRGGYIPLREFETIQPDDGIKLNPKENIHASLVGMAVDYLTRVNLGTDPESVFFASMRGAEIINETDEAKELLDEVKGIDNQSIINACKLSGYDVCYRIGPRDYRPVEEINPDEDTIENIRTMVKRGVTFFEEHGPVVLDGFTFEGAYTDIVTVGDGDFLTESTLWDFKVVKSKPNKNHTLQLFIYYLMGLRSKHKTKFEKLDSIGLFNPRLNIIYLLKIENISKDLMDEVSKKVIGYSD